MQDFLSNKFAATEAEKLRPAMEDLSTTQGTDQLTENEVIKGLKKMCNAMAKREGRMIFQRKSLKIATSARLHS